MINADLEPFLDSGWYSESEIYYQGFIYWCEAQWDFDTGVIHFFVKRWKATTSDYVLYNEYRKADGDFVDFSIPYELYNTDIDRIKKTFLLSPIFDGKSFWEVEPDLAWLEPGAPIVVD